MGMVGGGEGAFIGAVHRMAANLDGQIELVCGAFSADPERAARSGAALELPEHRVYADFREMMQREAALDAAERMQFVAVVTPNDLHYPVAEAALRAGFHVLSDKPATLTLDEAMKLRELVNSTGLAYALTHTYTGYPLVREARDRVMAGELGAVRKIVVDYSQGWLAGPAENSDNKQAAWRLDPARAGASCCMGDIGVHAANLAEYVSGERIESLCADLRATLPGRQLDDDGAVLLRFRGDMRGVLNASQVSAGEENNLRLRVYGEKGGLDWSQQEPNTLWLRWHDRPTQMLRTGGEYLGPAAAASTRTPMGHPEGYIEAFANIYRDFADLVRQWDEGAARAQGALPGIDEAIRGMQFIETAVAASASEQKWHRLEDL
jgi:predicted dehydrogenase